MPQTTIPFSELVERLSQGDEVAFKEIYTRFWDKLYLATYNKIRSTENAKEITQDIFLDLWHRRYEVQINDLEVYLFTAAKYQVFDFVKKEIVRKKYKDSVFFTDHDAVNTPENHFVFDELQQSVLAAIQTLPDKTRTIIELNRLHYKSADEISTECNIPTRTVEYHISQGLKTLRIHLKDFFILALSTYSSFF